VFPTGIGSGLRCFQVLFVGWLVFRVPMVGPLPIDLGVVV
jgi:hypothetical protein